MYVKSVREVLKGRIRQLASKEIRKEKGVGGIVANVDFPDDFYNQDITYTEVQEDRSSREIQQGEEDYSQVLFVRKQD